MYLTATTEYYNLSLHDALPICDFQVKQKLKTAQNIIQWLVLILCRDNTTFEHGIINIDTHVIPDFNGSNRVFECSIFKDRKSTRLNSSHSQISYAVFCLKKKI